ncbi:MAG TPA: hypothetical protein VF767_00365 [Bryobacteraceae bacterium]
MPLLLAALVLAAGFRGALRPVAVAICASVLLLARFAGGGQSRSLAAARGRIAVIPLGYEGLVWTFVPLEADTPLPSPVGLNSRT